MLDFNGSGARPQEYDIEDLSRRLADRAADWVPVLFPKGKIVGNELRLANIQGDPPRHHGSCVVALKGDKAACWFDHDPILHNKGGGPLSTLQHATGLIGRELYVKAAELVGEAPAKMRKRQARPSTPEDHIPLAADIWDRTVPPQGTLTERYLASRGLVLPPTEDLRHSNDCTDYAAKIGRPAMIARVRRADTGEPTGGIHRTYLTEDGRAAKGEMREHKMALGPIEDGVVMLAPMTADGRLGVAEGIESALAVPAIGRRFDPSAEPLPVWATLGTGGMADMPFPPGLKILQIFADAGKSGIRAAEKLQDRALASGYKAQIFLPKGGDDFAHDLELGLWEQPERAAPLPNDGGSIVSNGQAVPAHRGQAETVRTTDEIPPAPQTIEAILAAIETLTRQPNDPSLSRILRGIAIARLDPVGEKQCLQGIKAQTGVPIADLVKTLNQLRRELVTTNSVGPPVINLSNLSFVEITDAALRAIAAANTPERFFRFGGLPCRIAYDEHGVTITDTLNVPKMRHVLARVACWIQERPDGSVKEVPPPQVNVEDVLATPDAPLPVLVGIVTTPVFAPSGQLKIEPGYHHSTQLIYVPDGDFHLPPVSPVPTRDEVAEAKRLILEEVLGDFPFDGLSLAVGTKRGDAERAHTVALLLQSFVRQMISGPTPIFIIDKPAPGSGAQLLVDVISMIATGRPATPTTEARDDDEMRKKIASVLREGRQQFFLDNAHRLVDSAALASAVTARFWEDRLLGETRMMRAPVRCTWIIAGINVRTSDEVARRSIRIRLDAKMERPEERSDFCHPNLLIWIEENRPRLVWACLTLAQAWVAVGRPEHQRKLGSFESWCGVMGGILDIVEIRGFLGNIDDARSRIDAEGAALRAFVGAWWAEHGKKQTTTAQLFTITDKSDPALTLGDGTERSRKTKLGIILTRIRDRQFRIAVESDHRDQDDKPIPETIEVRIENPGTLQGAQQWNLVRIPAEVNLAEARDQSSPQGSRLQSIDSTDIREPREPCEPFPNLHARDTNTDESNSYDGHMHNLRMGGGDGEKGSQGSPGSPSPAIPGASDREPAREPRPGLTDGFTDEDRPAGDAVDVDPVEICHDRGGVRPMYGTPLSEATASEELSPADVRDFDEIEERLAIMTMDGGLTEVEARKVLGLPPACDTSSEHRRGAGV